MNLMMSEGVAVDVSVIVDFCPITYTLYPDTVELDFHTSTGLTITLTPDGLNNLIDQATTARAELHQSHATDPDHESPTEGPDITPCLA
ncbi:hypothetical protein [Actinokineospora sp. NBRC 105648]|uniref:hypothetical protein n=1 Tax=Actinokineospora sp. NBRC 105648 TaxID=3032206 RepID=UPI0024A228C7|nr:hypothetical protein [Actinokineospora sp. NBRC 105648]GLZ37621.1 hypothetical protein Acsp05_12460 [Actinokineospora sp. NBRC 105648]